MNKTTYGYENDLITKISIKNIGDYENFFSNPSDPELNIDFNFQVYIRNN